MECVRMNIQSAKGRKYAMYCQNCGKQIPDTVKFCLFCGTPTATSEPAQQAAAAVTSVMTEAVTESLHNKNAASAGTICPACGMPMSETDLFCPGCGSGRTAPGAKQKQAKQPTKPSKAGKRLVVTPLLCGLFAAAFAVVFGIGLLGGWLIGGASSSAAFVRPDAPVWQKGEITVATNDSDLPYAAFDVTCGADAETLHVIITTKQDGVLLLSKQMDDPGRMFLDAEKGDTLRVTLFPDFDDFAPVGEAFTGEDGTRFRSGKTAPLADYLKSGLSGTTYTFYFYDGDDYVGECTCVINFD